MLSRGFGSGVPSSEIRRSPVQDGSVAGPSGAMRSFPKSEVPDQQVSGARLYG